MNRRTFLSTTGALAAASPFAPTLFTATATAPAPAGSPKTPPAPKTPAMSQPPKLAPRFGDGRDWWFQKRFGQLKPLAQLPRRAILLNTGQPVTCSLDLVPSEHGDQGRYLRLTQLTVNAHANTVLVAKLEFDHLPAVIGPAKESGASIL